MLKFQSHLYGIESGLPYLRASTLPSFNRTFMELKVDNIVGQFATVISFNRTFMELKAYPPVLLLIRIMFQSHLYGIESCGAVPCPTTGRVSIAPLWN